MYSSTVNMCLLCNLRFRYFRGVIFVIPASSSLVLELGFMTLEGNDDVCIVNRDDLKMFFWFSIVNRQSTRKSNNSYVDICWVLLPFFLLITIRQNQKHKSEQHYISIYIYTAFWIVAIQTLRTYFDWLWHTRPDNMNPSTNAPHTIHHSNMNRHDNNYNIQSTSNNGSNHSSVIMDPTTTRICRRITFLYANDLNHHGTGNNNNTFSYWQQSSVPFHQSAYTIHEYNCGSGGVVGGVNSSSISGSSSSSSNAAFLLPTKVVATTPVGSSTTC